MHDMEAEVFLLFPDGVERFVFADPVPRIGESVQWTVGTWTLWTVRDVVHTIYPTRQPQKVDVYLVPKGADV